MDLNRSKARKWISPRIVLLGALTSAIVGLVQGVAIGAGAPVFDPFGQGYDPFEPVSGFDASIPALGDLDADGDLDAIVGDGAGTLRYFRNVGQVAGPSWAQIVGSSNPANGLLVAGNSAAPALVDLDGDGDLDLVVGSGNGVFTFFRNTGTPTRPAFAAAPNPLEGVDIGVRSTPTLADLDADGDADLLSGSREQGLFYFRNTGSKIAPNFAQQFGTANPFSGFAATVVTAPALADADGDGDFDAIIGTGSGFTYLENTGSPTRPAFRELANAANPLRGESVGLLQGASPTLGDYDGDGDLDIVSGKGDGGFVVFDNQIGQIVRSDDVDPLNLASLGFPNFGLTPTADFDADGDREIQVAGSVATNIGSATNPSFAVPALLPGGPNAVSRAADFDDDGDFELVSGGRLYWNVGTATNPSFVLAPSLLYPQSFQVGADLWLILGETLGDLDRDGDSDAAVVYNFGGPAGAYTTRYYENVGNASLPTFVERSGGANPLPSALTNAVVLSDVDGDGDSDANLAWGPSQTGYYCENVGTSSPVFLARATDDRKNPFAKYFESQVGSYPSGSEDMDGDGDPDAFGSEVVSIFPLTTVRFLLENGIVRPSPRALPLVGLPGASIPGSNSAVTAADFDGDGDADLVVVGAGLALRYYENIGTALLPDFVERINPVYGTPIVGLAAGEFGRLAAVDLDSNGKLEIVAGDYFGNPVRHFENEFGPTDPSYYLVPPIASPLGSITTLSAAAFADLDGDGDEDLVSGFDGPSLGYFENVGTARLPQFVSRSGAQNPFTGLSVGVGETFPAPTIGDIDRDGDFDVVVGGADGTFRYLENLGTAHTASFVLKTGVENPFDGADVGTGSAPALVDLDGDGDLDLITAAGDGTLRFARVPEPGLSALLAAGGTMLGWMSRRRLARAA